MKFFCTLFGLVVEKHVHDEPDVHEGDAKEDLKSDKTWEQEEPTKSDQWPKTRNMQPIP